MENAQEIMLLWHTVKLVIKFQENLNEWKSKIPLILNIC